MIIVVLIVVNNIIIELAYEWEVFCWNATYLRLGMVPSDDPKIYLQTINNRK